MERFVSPQKILAVAFIVISSGAALWDVYATHNGRSIPSVSGTLQDWSVKFPILPLVCGIILGHLFWPVGSNR